MNVTAKIVDAQAITVVCEECDVPCVSQNTGSHLIVKDDDETALCPGCHTVYSVPPQVFLTVSKAKLKEKKY